MDLGQLSLKGYGPRLNQQIDQISIHLCLLKYVPGVDVLTCEVYMITNICFYIICILNIALVWLVYIQALTITIFLVYYIIIYT